MTRALPFSYFLSAGSMLTPPPCLAYYISCIVFQGYCAAQRIQLNLVSITATPTGTATTGDPLSMFEAPAPTSGATVAVTMELPPLIPSYSVQTPGQAQPKTGSAIGLNAFRALDMSIVVAAGAVTVLLGVSSF